MNTSNPISDQATSLVSAYYLLSRQGNQKLTELFCSVLQNAHFFFLTHDLSQKQICALNITRALDSMKKQPQESPKKGEIDVDHKDIKEMKEKGLHFLQQMTTVSRTNFYSFMKNMKPLIKEIFPQSPVNIQEALKPFCAWQKQQIYGLILTEGLIEFYQAYISSERIQFIQPLEYLLFSLDSNQRRDKGIGYLQEIGRLLVNEKKLQNVKSNTETSPLLRIFVNYISLAYEHDLLEKGDVYYDRLFNALTKFHAKQENSQAITIGEWIRQKAKQKKEPEMQAPFNPQAYFEASNPATISDENVHFNYYTNKQVSIFLEPSPQNHALSDIGNDLMNAQQTIEAVARWDIHDQAHDAKLKNNAVKRALIFGLENDIFTILQLGALLNTYPSLATNEEIQKALLDAQKRSLNLFLRR